MVSVSIIDGKLMLRVEGLDKALALKGSLEIPLDQVAAVRADPMVALIRPDLTRAPGSFAPGSSKPGTFLESGLSLGLIAVGTFWEDGRRVFWDVKNPTNAIVISLRNHRYDELVVEVADPQQAVRTIEFARHGQDASPQDASS